MKTLNPSIQIHYSENIDLEKIFVSKEYIKGHEQNVPISFLYDISFITCDLKMFVEHVM